MRYVSVRWLSLEAAIMRALKLYTSLCSYFKSENESQPRFKRLQKIFSNPLTEAYLLFFQSVLSCFTSLNLLLQREYPNIFLVADAIRSFLRTTFSKFLTIQAIKSNNDITLVNFTDHSNHLIDNALGIGLVTKSTLERLLKEGDISEYQYRKFFEAAKGFFIKTAIEALAKLPFDDDILHHAKFVNFEQRETCTFDSVEFFCNKYSSILPLDLRQKEQLNQEFIGYQLLEKSSLPQHVWDEAAITDGPDDERKHYRMDIIWGYIAAIKNVDDSLRFPRLARVSKLVLIIPHSNAGEEHAFNLIKLNKTPTRSSLDSDGTLASVIQIKLANNSSCVTWESFKEVLRSSKKATVQYNLQHKNS